MGFSKEEIEWRASDPVLALDIGANNLAAVSDGQNLRRRQRRA
jgi:transposase